MRPHPSASRGQRRESSWTNKWAQSKLQPMPKLSEVQLVASVEPSCLKRSQRGHGALFSNLHRCRQNWTSDLKSQQTRRQKWSCWDSSSPHVQFWWVFGLIWYKIDESQHFCWVETGYEFVTFSWTEPLIRLGSISFETPNLCSFGFVYSWGTEPHLRLLAC